MSRVVSLRLKDDQVTRLQRAARHLGRTPSEAAALLLEEALRQRDFAFIEFRDSPVGRQAYLQGTRLAVWQVAALARACSNDLERTAAALDLPVVQVMAAMNYSAEYPDEIAAALADQENARLTLQRLLPAATVLDVDLDAAAS